MSRIVRFADRNWRPAPGVLISTGDYRVPEDMPEDLAQRAVSEGAAVFVMPPPPAPAPARRGPKGGP